MPRRRGYVGISDPQERFDAMRPAVVQLQRLIRDHYRLTPAGDALDHPVMSIRLAANLLTQTHEFFGLLLERDDGRYVRMAAEFQELRPSALALQEMARTYHPATPEARSLQHAADALRMAADVLTGQPDFFRIRVGDGSSAPFR